MATAHSHSVVPLVNKFALLEEADPFQEPRVTASVEDHLGTSTIVNSIDSHSRQSIVNTAAVYDYEDTQDNSSWHVKESRKKRPALNNSNNTSHTSPKETQTQVDDHPYFYGDDNEDWGETDSAFYGSGAGASWPAISPSDEHELSKSSRAINRKNVRLATKHQQKVTAIKTSQKVRADSIENRERRKNPSLPHSTFPSEEEQWRVK
ncbi:hypothetical protein BGW42_000021 [Actinomortierella wolfii]|nr:hypothetical protein BGW42_000021 [Actinomortierella wolfii]